MSYGFTITSQGWRLLTKLQAGAARLEISRVMVGNGRVADDIDPASLTDLISPVARATSTLPVMKDTTVSFVVEYRTDLDGGLEEGFYINEYSVHAQDPDEGEIMLYYATLGDRPQYVAGQQSGSLDIRRFPVSIALTDKLEVVLAYPPLAFMTAENIGEYTTSTMLPEFLDAARDYIEEHDASISAHQGLRNTMNNLENRVGQLEDMIIHDISSNPFIVTFGDLSKLVVEGVWNRQYQRIEF